ncbi:MAG: hypothetical protein GX677_08725 [Treponema sp.]|jgi:hypothetical protein|nr:hypothetical protein [Treponema sp.]
MDIKTLQFYTEIKKDYEFTYKNKKYDLSYKKDNNGKDLILFGLQYQQQIFHSFNELINNAKIENSFFREVIKVL